MSKLSFSASDHDVSTALHAATLPSRTPLWRQDIRAYRRHLIETQHHGVRTQAERRDIRLSVANLHLIDTGAGHPWQGAKLTLLNLDRFDMISEPTASAEGAS